jgi:hypothetical protein
MSNATIYNLSIFIGKSQKLCLFIKSQQSSDNLIILSKESEKFCREVSKIFFGSAKVFKYALNIISS